MYGLEKFINGGCYNFSMENQLQQEGKEKTTPLRVGISIAGMFGGWGDIEHGIK